MSEVAIIIVNFRTGALVGQSLHAIARERGAVSRPIVVYIIDNHSMDGSVELLSALIDKEEWGDWVRLRPKDRNGGFAAGNNAALAEILTNDEIRYVYFLNPDAVIRPNAISTLLRFLDECPKASIVGTRLEEPDGRPSSSAFRFPSAISEFLDAARIGYLDRLFERWIVARPPAEQSHPTDWVSGASFVVRKEVFDRVGLLDEGYFLYFEEVDFMKAASAAGFEVWHFPDAKVVHEAGSSTKLKDGRSNEGALPPYWYESWRRYFTKHHGRSGILLAAAAWFAGRSLAWSLEVLRLRPKQLGSRRTATFLMQGVLPAFLSSGQSASHGRI